MDKFWVNNIHIHYLYQLGIHFLFTASIEIAALKVAFELMMMIKVTFPISHRFFHHHDHCYETSSSCNYIINCIFIIIIPHNHHHHCPHHHHHCPHHHHHHHHHHHNHQIIFITIHMKSLGLTKNRGLLIFTFAMATKRRTDQFLEITHSSYLCIDLDALPLATCH